MENSTLDLSPKIFVTLEELENIIKETLRKTGLHKELDLCTYLFYEGDRLSPEFYLELKDSDRLTLYRLIQENILDTRPSAIFSKRTKTSEKLSYTGQPLEACVQEAIVKLNVQRETALCKYIPYGKGHLHHFTYLKMKSENPIQLRNLIKMHILDQRPHLLPPMKRKQYVSQHPRQPAERPSVGSVEEGVAEVIRQAMQREDLEIKTEEDLCRYLPQGGAFLHPLGFRDLKRNNRRELIRLIREHVITPAYPEPLEGKKIDRYPSSINVLEDHNQLSQKKRFHLSAEDRIDQLLEAVSCLVNALQRTKTDKTASAKSRASEKCFQIIQVELISKILKKEIDLNL